MNCLRHFILTVIVAASVMLVSDAAYAEQNNWSIAVIPDTQYYVSSAKNAPLFTEITRWLVDNKEELNLQLVLHVGDIVDENTTEQWERAKESLSHLDNQLPYVLAVGNHDLGDNASDRSTMLNDYFKVSDNPLNEVMFGGCFQPGHLENAWYRFQYGDVEYIIFSLEFGVRDEVVRWVDQVAVRHDKVPFILLTHDFIDQESALFSEDGMAEHTTTETKNSPYSYGISEKGSVNCGQQLWDKLICRYPNFQFTFNGHYKAYRKTGPQPDEVEKLWDALAVGYRKDVYQNGNVIHQMLFNAQWAPKGGNGWIRILEFTADGRLVHVKTFSPHLAHVADNATDAWQTQSDMQFDLDITDRLGE